MVPLLGGRTMRRWISDVQARPVSTIGRIPVVAPPNKIRIGAANERE
jgi:hypothetical protein